MARTRNPKDLSVEELRQLLIDKRRSERQNRLDHYRKTGRVIMVEPQPAPASLEAYTSEPLVLDENGESRPKVSRGRLFLDRFLFVIEVAAVVGLAFVLFNGMSLLRNLNKEVAAVLEQPTLTPTPLISAVVLPSGHTPPNKPGGAQFNEAEIPEHLRPLVQSLASPTQPACKSPPSAWMRQLFREMDGNSSRKASDSMSVRSTRAKREMLYFPHTMMYSEKFSAIWIG